MQDLCLLSLLKVDSLKIVLTLFYKRLSLLFVLFYFLQYMSVGHTKMAEEAKVACRPRSKYPGLDVQNQEFY